jgi:hypothetical protein
MATNVKFIFDDDNNVVGMDKVDQGHWHLTVPYDVVGDTVYWLVRVVFTTGDSERRDPTPIDEFIDMYETEEQATAVRDVLVKHTKDHSEFRWGEKSVRPSEKVTYMTSKGVALDLVAPWIGTFERLEFIEIVPVKIGKKYRITRDDL